MLKVCVVAFMCILTGWSVRALVSSEGYIRAQEMKKRIRRICKKVFKK